MNDMTMNGMTLTIALVKLYNDFYVLFKPSYTNYYNDYLNPDLFYENLSNELWGEGTAVKTFFVREPSDVENAIKAFEELIEIYEDSCLLSGEDSLIDYHENVEDQMILMGLPLCYAKENDDPTYDTTFVFLANDFKNRILPKINEKYPSGTFCDNKKMVMNIIRICCEKSNTRGT